MTIRRRSTRLSGLRVCLFAESPSPSFPLSHDFNAIKSSCWLVCWLVGWNFGGLVAISFCLARFGWRLEESARRRRRLRCLLCKTNKMEGRRRHNRPPSRKNSLPGGWVDPMAGHRGLILSSNYSISFHAISDSFWILREMGRDLTHGFSGSQNICGFRKRLALCRFRSSPFVCPLARWKLPKQWRDRELAKAKHHPPNAASFFLPSFHFRVLQKYNLNEPNGVFD